MNFENCRIPQLQNIQQGINHKVEVLQQKMADDMGRSTYLDIHPRNYPIIPEIKKCSLHDLELLDDLTSKQFDCFWTLEKKKAEQKGAMEKYYAEFKYYSLRNTLNDDEVNELFIRIDAFCNQRMSTHKIIECIMESPNFLEEVCAL